MTSAVEGSDSLLHANHASDHRSFTDKMADEARLIWGAKDHVLDGVKSAFKDMHDSPEHAISLGIVSLGLGYFSQYPAVQAGMLAMSALGLGTLVGVPAYEVWKNGNNLAAAQKQLGDATGFMLGYTPVTALGYFVGGSLAENKLYQQALARTQPTGEEEAAVSMDKSAARTYFQQNEARSFEAVKQPYNVQFEKVTGSEPVRLPTLENTGEGQIAKPGSWIATRLDASGQPATVNGMVDQWPMNTESVLSAYQTSAEQLEGVNKIVLPVKLDKPPVRMIALNGTVHLGSSQTGARGSFLTNYDFNRVTAEAGTKFSIVNAQTFQQTYQAAHPQVFGLVPGLTVTALGAGDSYLTR